MVKGYSPVQIALHWGVGLLIIYQLLFGDAMKKASFALRNDPAAALSTGAWVHIIIGSLVLLLVLWRLSLRFTRGAPPPPENDTKVQTMAASVVHFGLYLLMLAMPITGLLGWYGGIHTLSEMHGELLKALVWVFIAAHVLAALYHQFVLRDGLLSRMRRSG